MQENFIPSQFFLYNLQSDDDWKKKFTMKITFNWADINWLVLLVNDEVRRTEVNIE